MSCESKPDEKWFISCDARTTNVTFFMYMGFRDLNMQSYCCVPPIQSNVVSGIAYTYFLYNTNLGHFYIIKDLFSKNLETEDLLSTLLLAR